jgi:hypothetical protein
MVMTTNPAVIRKLTGLVKMNQVVGEKGIETLRYTIENRTENTTVPIILYLSNKNLGTLLPIVLTSLAKQR